MKKCTDRKGITILMALLLLLPMISMIAGGVGAVTTAVLAKHLVRAALAGK